MLGLQGEGATHVEVYFAVAQSFHLVDEKKKLLQALEDDLWHYGHAFIVLRVDVSVIFGADVSCFNTNKGGIVTFNATNQLVVDAAVHVVGVALQWGKVDGSHGVKVRKSYKKREKSVFFRLFLSNAWR